MPTPKRFFEKEIVKELRRIESLMKEAENPERKNYLFSAAYGIMGRTYRYEFSRDVLLCCLLYTSPSPRDGLLSRMPSSA